MDREIYIPEEGGYQSYLIFPPLGALKRRLQIMDVKYSKYSKDLKYGSFSHAKSSHSIFLSVLPQEQDLSCPSSELGSKPLFLPTICKKYYLLCMHHEEEERF